MSEKEEFIRSFREIQPKFSRFYARILTQADLSLPQYALLNQLTTQGTVSMTEISGKLFISKPAVTSLADRLERNKLLKRVGHPSDRRIFLLQILPKGERVVRKIQTQALQFLLKTLDQFNVTERRTIIRFYTSLSKTMDQLLAQGLKTRK